MELTDSVITTLYCSLEICPIVSDIVIKAGEKSFNHSLKIYFVVPFADLICLLYANIIFTPYLKSVSY